MLYFSFVRLAFFFEGCFFFYLSFFYGIGCYLFVMCFVNLVSLFGDNITCARLLWS